MGDLKAFFQALYQATQAEKLGNASAVDSNITRVMRALSAPKRSASKALLLALGKAATSTTAIKAVGVRGKPSCINTQPKTHTNTG